MSILRPVRLLPGIVPPLRDKSRRHRFWIVRENSEGNIRSAAPLQRRDRRGDGDPEAVFTRRGTDRILRYAFELATRLGRPHVTSATKSNGIWFSMPFWTSALPRSASTIQTFAPTNITSNIGRPFRHVAGALRCRRRQQSLRRHIVDLGPGITGTIAVAPSANINPERHYPSMFEPVHGSAPDIAGQGIANPIGQIWSAAMMLDHLGEGRPAGDHDGPGASPHQPARVVDAASAAGLPPPSSARRLPGRWRRADSCKRGFSLRQTALP